MFPFEVPLVFGVGPGWRQQWCLLVRCVLARYPQKANTKRAAEGAEKPSIVGRLALPGKTARSGA